MPRDAACPPTSTRLRGQRDCERSGWSLHAEHPGRALMVAGVRLGRVWGALQPHQQVNVSGRRRGIQKAGVAMYYALLVAAAFGVAQLRNRTAELFVLATPLLV